MPTWESFDADYLNLDRDEPDPFHKPRKVYMKTPKTKEIILHMLKVLSTPESCTKKFTEWERNFIISFRNYSSHEQMSDRQFEILERIYAEKTE